MQTPMDTNKSVNWNIVNMLCFHNNPSLIPGVKMTAGNRKLIGNLWVTLSAVWGNTQDINRLHKIGMNYIALHPKKKDEITATCTHFTHLMGIHYPVYGDEYNAYEKGIHEQV